MTVEVEQRDHVRIVTINRPHARNAVDGPTAALLADAFRDFDSDDESYVAILTGADGAFCAGADLKAVATGSGNRMSTSGDGPMGPSRMLLSKPVIAAVEGHAHLTGDLAHLKARPDDERDHRQQNGCGGRPSRER